MRQMTAVARGCSWVALVACAWCLPACAHLSRVTYAQAQEGPGVSVTTQQVELAERVAARRTWGIENGAELATDGASVRVIAETRRDLIITLGPLVFPVVPFFPLDWIATEFRDRVLEIEVRFSEPGYELDPMPVLIVRDDEQLAPAKVTKRNGALHLEYEFRSWDFILSQGAITGPSGTWTLPDLHFAPATVWVTGVAP